MNARQKSMPGSNNSSTGRSASGRAASQAATSRASRSRSRKVDYIVDEVPLGLVKKRETAVIGVNLELRP